MEFHDWIRQKYLNWADNKKSESQFALYLDISQATINAWMNRTRGIPRSKEIISKLADKLGPEIYEVLDYPKQASPLDNLPVEYRTSLEEAMEEISCVLKENGISIQSDEGKKLSSQIMEKHGWYRASKES